MRMEKNAEEEHRARRLQTEAALSEGELNFQLLANSIPQRAWMAHADGWIFWYNRRCTITPARPRRTWRAGDGAKCTIRITSTASWLGSNIPGNQVSHGRIPFL
jgi:hypothetical protein